MSKYKYFFSATDGGFYDAQLHENMPPDVVPVADEDYRALMDGQQQGQHITFADGRPVLTSPPAEVIEAQARFEAKHTGEEIAGVKVSLTEENQNGIASVLAGAQLAAEVGHSMFPINFNVMTAAGVQAVPFNTMDELKAFALAFMAARQQFFQ